MCFVKSHIFLDYVIPSLKSNVLVVVVVLGSMRDFVKGALPGAITAAVLENPTWGREGEPVWRVLLLLLLLYYNP